MRQQDEERGGGGEEEEGVTEREADDGEMDEFQGEEEEDDLLQPQLFWFRKQRIMGNIQRSGQTLRAPTDLNYYFAFPPLPPFLSSLPPLSIPPDTAPLPSSNLPLSQRDLQAVNIAELACG
ncbi:unnamed protein product [Pleuronectes platessa]|uniref:Uncharacterized protein n=1 Tax=Pleuronectes platessa TaxID=8262 RepID=A0A9N7YS16_PLEPL|nr:unnamed protein product [Pleuronectes platessa]